MRHAWHFKRTFRVGPCLWLACSVVGMAGPLGTPPKDQFGNRVSREEQEIRRRKDERWEQYKVACGEQVPGSTMDCEVVKKLIQRAQRCAGMRIAWDGCYKRFLKTSDHVTSVEDQIRSLGRWNAHGRLEKVCGPQGLPPGSDQPEQFRYPGGC